VSEGKIKFHEALAYKAERNGDYAEAHTQWQMAEYYKRKDNELEIEQRAHTTRKGKSSRRGFHRVRPAKEPIGD